MDNKYEILWDRLREKIGRIRIWQGKTWITIRQIMKDLEDEYKEV